MKVPPRISRVILTYGRFDFFHQGHVRFLQSLSRMGDDVIVGCTTDALAQARGLPCAMTFEQRRGLLESCRYVSRVVTEVDAGQKRTDIVNYNACALAMGMDDAGKYDDMQDIAQVLYMPRESGFLLTRTAEVPVQKLGIN